MKNKKTPLSLTLALFCMALLGACSDNTSKEDNIIIREEQPPIQNFTPEKEYHFTFKSLEGEENGLVVKNNFYNFKNIKQPIVIVNIMATWCPPCRGQLPHLSKLQKEFKEHVFVTSMLVHDDISNEQLKKFLIAQKANLFVSISQKENLKFMEMIEPKLRLSKEFPMPLTLLFYQGKYFSHYEGMIPEEMIESDIKQLLKKIKS